MFNSQANDYYNDLVGIAPKPTPETLNKYHAN